MSCYSCKYYTGEGLLPCGVDPITATSSPEEGCRDWQPTGDNYKPVPLKVKRPFSTYLFWFVILIAYPAAIAAYAVVNINNKLNDRYELSPPGSVQHIRED